jgi:predicted enzyme related to lactoylglutathione lyase
MANVVLILDCNDLDRTAEFWAGALRYQAVYRSEPYLVLMPQEESDGSGLVLQLQRVPEPKQGKNRLHLDLHVDDLEPEVERLSALGARPVNTDVAQESGFRWQVMADPEGNEFCVCAACAQD